MEPLLGGVLHYLWRAVDQHGVVLDILVQDRRNGAAAKRFFKHLLHGLQYKPRRLVTDGLRSYGVAQRAILPDVRHRMSSYLNNRAENSHRPTRRRERQMQRLKSASQAQRFLSAHAMIYGHFRPRRHLMAAAGIDAFARGRSGFGDRRPASIKQRDGGRPRPRLSAHVSASVNLAMPLCGWVARAWRVGSEGVEIDRLGEALEEVRAGRLGFRWPEQLGKALRH